MSKFIIKVVFFGLLIGLLISVVLMSTGTIVHFLAEAVGVHLSHYFLRYTAIASFIVGLSCTLIWYIYLLILAKKMWKQIITNFFTKE